jgi:NAD(P)-dependent dehydrogenase (short-subunit alcohol dehydrogenase family)
MKTVLITGVSRGIGKATAEKFLAEGWKVVGTSTSGKLPFEHENLEAMQLDLSDSESIQDAAEKILAHEEKIDVLVNNAGIALEYDISGVELDKMRKTFEVIVFGTVAFTEKMLGTINEHGHIINIDSNYGSFSSPVEDTYYVGYRMAKAALNMYTRTLALRLGKYSIVSSLDPGWTNTDMGRLGTDEGEIPTREPEQVAEEIFILATSEVETGHFWFNREKREW